MRRAGHLHKWRVRAGHIVLFQFHVDLVEFGVVSFRSIVCLLALSQMDLLLFIVVHTLPEQVATNRRKHARLGIHSFVLSRRHVLDILVLLFEQLNLLIFLHQFVEILRQ